MLIINEDVHLCIGGSPGSNTRTFLPLCPPLLSLLSSCGKLRTSRGGWNHLDHDLSSGALRQIKARHLMRGDWGDLPSCFKSSLDASTLSSHCTWSRLHCPAILITSWGAALDPSIFHQQRSQLIFSFSFILFYKQTEPELFKCIVSVSQQLLGTTSPLLNDTAKAFDLKAENQPHNRLPQPWN